MRGLHGNEGESPYYIVNNQGPGLLCKELLYQAHRGYIFCNKQIHFSTKKDRTIILVCKTKTSDLNFGHHLVLYSSRSYKNKCMKQEWLLGKHQKTLEDKVQ